MAWWKYEIYSLATGELLCQDSGYETEEDAERFAKCAAKEKMLPAHIIRTLQEWEDLD